jgi:hypothetical protein
VDQVRANTGFELLVGADPEITDSPRELELAALRHLDPDRLYTS